MIWDIEESVTENIWNIEKRVIRDKTFEAWNVSEFLIEIFATLKDLRFKYLKDFELWYREYLKIWSSEYHKIWKFSSVMIVVLRVQTFNFWNTVLRTISMHLQAIRKCR